MSSDRDCYAGWISTLKDLGISQYAAWILAAARPFHVLLAQFLTFCAPLIPTGSSFQLPLLIDLFEDEEELAAFSLALQDKESPA